jgi:hypothetical protein
MSQLIKKKRCRHVFKITFSKMWGRHCPTVRAEGKSLYPRLLPVCEWVVLCSRSRCTVYMSSISCIREQVNVISPSLININYPLIPPWGNRNFHKNTHIFLLFSKGLFLLQLLPRTYLLCFIISLFHFLVFIFSTQPSKNYFGKILSFSNNF